MEFNKLQNLDTVKSAADADTPLELSFLSKTTVLVWLGSHLVCLCLCCLLVMVVLL